MFFIIHNSCSSSSIIPQYLHMLRWNLGNIFCRTSLDTKQCMKKHSMKSEEISNYEGPRYTYLLSRIRHLVRKSLKTVSQKYGMDRTVINTVRSQNKKRPCFVVLCSLVMMKNCPWRTSTRLMIGLQPTFVFSLNSMISLLDKALVENKNNFET